MGQMLLVAISSFIVTIVAVLFIKPIACFIGLVDKPGGRKQHLGLVPLIGGISVFIGVLVTILTQVEQTEFVRFFLIGSGMIVLLGALDDRYDISAAVRLCVQILIALMFTYGLGIYLKTFGDIVGLGSINIGMFGQLVTLIAMVGVINAMNMLDGIDGLVGGVGGVSLLGLGLLCWVSGDVSVASICFSIASSLSAFLIFNLWGAPSRKSLIKIFMGDAGSMFLGLTLAVILVRGSQGASVSFLPINAAWFVLLPCTDMLTTIARRIRRGRSPIAPDRTHIHHLLLRAGFSRAGTLSTLLVLQLVLVGFGVALTLLNAPAPLSFLLMIIFVGAYELAMARSWRLIRWSRRYFSLTSNKNCPDAVAINRLVN